MYINIVQLYKILINFIIGICIGIYAHSNTYMSITCFILLIFVNKFDLKQIKCILPGFFIGYFIILVPHQTFTKSGVVTYIGNNLVFIENSGTYKIDTNKIKLNEHITFCAHDNKIQKIYERNNSKPMLPFIVKQRENLKQFIMQNKYYDFWLAILIGDKTYIKNHNLQKLLDSNIYHLIVISGFHLSIIYNFVYYIINQITQRSKTVNYYCTIYSSYDIIPHCIACAACLYYFFLSLYGIASIRAIAMILLKKSPYSPKTILCILMIISILYNPYFIYNKGFILSYVITFLLLEKQSNTNIAIFASNVTNNFNPLTLFNNLIGNCIIQILFPLGILAFIVNEINILNILNSLIEIFINHLPSLNVIIKVPTITILEIMAILQTIYIQQLNSKYLYVSFAILLIFQFI